MKSRNRKKHLRTTCSLKQVKKTGTVSRASGLGSLCEQCAEHTVGHIYTFDNEHSS
jgi:hypothetical protein